MFNECKTLEEPRAKDYSNATEINKLSFQDDRRNNKKFVVHFNPILSSFFPLVLPRKYLNGIKVEECEQKEESFELWNFFKVLWLFNYVTLLKKFAFILLTNLMHGKHSKLQMRDGSGKIHFLNLCKLFEF